MATAIWCADFAHRDLLGLRPRAHGVVAAHHHLTEPPVDVAGGPEDLLQVLNPLEVRHHEAPGVGKDVGDDEDVALVQDGVAVGIDGRVGALADDAGAHRCGVGRGDGRLEGGGDEQVDLERQQLRIGERLGADVVRERATFLLERRQRVDVEAGVVVEAADCRRPPRRAALRR